MLHRLTSYFNKLFRLQQWYIGWAKVPVQQFLRDPASVEFNWIIPRQRRTFIADPFGIESEDGHLKILAERLVQGRSHGEVILIDTRQADDSNWQLLLRQAWHLSYPMVVHDHGRRFVVPEQGASGTVSAYALHADNTIDSRPTWTQPDWPALDSTPLFHEGRWWLFSARRGDPHWGGALRLHYSDALAGPWHEHPKSPVVTDWSRARPGGRVALVGGRLMRPAQDCSTIYGGALVINEITRLSPDDYEEKVVLRVLPGTLRAPGGAACHHLDHTAQHILVDAMRYTYHPLAWWFKLRS
jgi:hypothetical protein